MEQQEQENRKPAMYSSTGSALSGELLSGIDFQTLLRPKDDWYGFRITGDTPYCDWIMVVLGVEGNFFKGSDEVKSGVAYLGIGPGIRYRIGNFFFSANLYPYAGYKGTEYKVRGEKKKEGKFDYGAMATLSLGFKLFSSTNHDYYLSGGYTIMSDEFETKGLFDTGRWMVGLTVSY